MLLSIIDDIVRIVIYFFQIICELHFTSFPVEVKEYAAPDTTQIKPKVVCSMKRRKTY